MRRLVFVFLLVLALPAGAQAETPQLSAKLTACRTGSTAAQRAATIVASMPAVARTAQMAMRFDLLARPGSADDYAVVKAPRLGVWRKSAPGTPSSGFVFTQRVQGLATMTSYKVMVRFRWYDATGTLLRSATRQSRVCRQPDRRPKLLAGALEVAPGPQPDQATYRLVVRNDGLTAAGPFDVVLSLGEVEQPAQRVFTGLAAAGSRAVTFVAPRCALGSTVRFELDAGDEIDQPATADHVVERACPLAE